MVNLGKVLAAVETDGVTTLTVEDGRQWTLDATCVCTVNGAEAEAGDLQAGDILKVDGKPAVRVEAFRRK